MNDSLQRGREHEWWASDENHEGNMKHPAVQQYRTHLTLVPSPPIPFRPVDGRRRTIDRAMHHLTLVAAQSVQADVPEAHREWWYDLRRSHQSVLAPAFRFVDFLHRLGFPFETAILVSDWLRAYTMDRYGITSPSPSPIEGRPSLRRVA